MSGAFPYQAIAPFYDRIMAHVDYPRWAAYLRALWRRHGGGERPARLLEFAAGTCRFASPALFPGAFAVHTDPSPAMLKTRGGSGLRVACDARFPAVKGPFDLALMMYDSLNYLLSPRDVSRVLRAAKRALRRGGLFIFDVTTEGCSRRHFADATDCQELEDGAYIRRSLYDSGIRLQLNLFTFFVPRSGGGFERHEEIHSQRVYPAADLRDLAERAGFEILAVLSGFSFRTGDDRSERLHFVLRKP